VDCGVEFKATFYSEPCWEPPTDDGLVYTGGENAHPFNTIAAPAPRGHIPRMQGKRLGERSAGWMLVQGLAAHAEALGARVITDARSDGVVVDADGAVAGVLGRRYGKDLAVRARRGVVLAGGGFAANAAMVAEHTPRIAGHAALGTDGDDGTSIRIGQGLGAAVRHLDAAEAAIPTSPALLYRSLLVNRNAQRFINEDTYAGRSGQMALFHQEGKVFMILDEESFESVPPSERWNQPTWAAGSVAELEKEMGFPDGALQSTVEYFNHHAAAGEDPLFRKRREWVKPLRSPFGAIDLTGLQYSVFTLGGLETTVDGEVVGPGGGPIPGLFAAGRATSGIPSWGYASGTSLGDGTFFGRRAGRKAGSLEPRAR
jgi:3-oxo-5alpha-steroid 4-dehydrogenase